MCAECYVNHLVPRFAGFGKGFGSRAERGIAKRVFSTTPPGHAEWPGPFRQVPRSARDYMASGQLRADAYTTRYHPNTGVRFLAPIFRDS
jgi:hypothetical protein